MWTLILVLTFSTTQGSGVATPVIPGFSSKQACDIAGQAVPNIKRYICVEVR